MKIIVMEWNTPRGILRVVNSIGDDLEEDQKAFDYVVEKIKKQACEKAGWIECREPDIFEVIEIDIDMDEEDIKYENKWYEY